MQTASISSAYTSYRSYLFAIAYNMLGEVHEAEDIVQDVFETLLRKQESNIVHPKAYLSRMTINRCIDRLDKRKVAQQSYIGPWLPEPIMTENEHTQKDVLSYVMLCLLEQLNPLERAVLLLRESFDYEYSEIADICNIKEDNCRQLLHRAKAKVKRPLKAETTNNNDRSQELLRSFVTASFSGNVEALISILHKDIVMYSDGGGKAAAASKPLVGAYGISKFFTGYGQKAEAASVTWKFVQVNNQPALVLVQEGQIIAIFSMLEECDQIRQLYVIRNPDKIFFSDPVTK